MRFFCVFLILELNFQEILIVSFNLFYVLIKSFYLFFLFLFSNLGKAKNIISNLCHSDMNKRLVDPEEIKSNKYFDIPWSVVGERYFFIIFLLFFFILIFFFFLTLIRRLIPHFIPRLHEGHDQYFEKFNPTKYTPGDFGCDFVSVPEAFYWD